MTKIANNALEVSPLLAYDEAKALHKKANRRNLFIKIPGTREGGPAIHVQHVESGHRFPSRSP